MLDVMMWWFRSDFLCSAPHFEMPTTFKPSEHRAHRYTVTNSHANTQTQNGRTHLFCSVATPPKMHAEMHLVLYKYTHTSHANNALNTSTTHVRNFKTGGPCGAENHLGSQIGCTRKRTQNSNAPAHRYYADGRRLDPGLSGNQQILRNETKIKDTPTGQTRALLSCRDAYAEIAHRLVKG